MSATVHPKPSKFPVEPKLNDNWSPTIVMISAVYAFALVLTAEIVPAFLLFVVGMVPLIFISFFVWFCYDLKTNRFRHALSLIVAVVTATMIVRCAPLVLADGDTLSFYAHLSEYNQQVEEARAHQTAQGPLQVVVDYQDRSGFVTTNLFYYVIYDETDGAGPYTELFWPYAASNTGVIAVTVPSKIYHLSGHYYNFST